MLIVNRILIVLLTIVNSHSAVSAPEKKLLPEWRYNDEHSSITIDHSRWQTILDAYLITQGSQTLFNYSTVSGNDKSLIKSYTQSLASIDPGTLNRKEQKAYWINLYNALTVQLVLDEYPIQSITKIGKGFLSFGPWNDDVITINQTSVSLNDIEHGILRPIYNDPRIHYAVNCASMGCPDLLSTAYTASNTEELMDQAAKSFINHSRGVSIEEGKLTLSKIYDWYEDDFDGGVEGVLQHIKLYANKALLEQLNRLKDPKVRFQYDWALNQP